MSPPVQRAVHLGALHPHAADLVAVGNVGLGLGGAGQLGAAQGGLGLGFGGLAGGLGLGQLLLQGIQLLLLVRRLGGQGIHLPAHRAQAQGLADRRGGKHHRQPCRDAHGKAASAPAHRAPAACAAR